MKQNKVSIAITGHRPNKLWGYDLSNPHYIALQAQFESKLEALGCTDAYTGMALGADTVFAHAVLALRNRGVNIRLHCAIPCRNHSCRWNFASRREYDRILSLADETVLVTDAPYSPYLMQVRNEYMVDRANRIIALWDGTGGGTCNCVRYAERKRVPVDVIRPVDIRPA